MSSGDESHSVSNVSGAADSEESLRWDDSPGNPSEEQSWEEEDPTGEEGGLAEGSPSGADGGDEPVEGPPAPRGAGRTRASRSSTRPSEGPMSEVSSMTDDDIARIRATYRIPDNFHLHAPRPGDRVTSGPRDCLAVYEEDLLAGLRFPLHPFLVDIMRRYRLVPAQLGPNSFRVLVCFDWFAFSLKLSLPRPCSSPFSN